MGPLKPSTLSLPLFLSTIDKNFLSMKYLLAVITNVLYSVWKKKNSKTAISIMILISNFCTSNLEKYLSQILTCEYLISQVIKLCWQPTLGLKKISRYDPKNITHKKLIVQISSKLKYFAFERQCEENKRWFSISVYTFIFTSYIYLDR